MPKMKGDEVNLIFESKAAAKQRVKFGEVHHHAVLSFSCSLDHLIILNNSKFAFVIVHMSFIQQRKEALTCYM